jgi:hypothetical protein
MGIVLAGLVVGALAAVTFVKLRGGDAPVEVRRHSGRAAADTAGCRDPERGRTLARGRLARRCRAPSGCRRCRRRGAAV